MGYSADVLQRARARLAAAKADRESENRQHLDDAYARVPRLREIDRQLRLTMAMAAQAVFSSGGDVNEALENAKPMDFGRLQVMATTLTCTVNHSTDHLVPICEAIWEEKDPEKKEQMCEEAGICSFAEPGMIIRRSKFAETEEMPLATLALGDLGFGFFPFEMFNANGVQLRAASPFPMTFPCGYSLTYLGYMPSCTAVPHGGYEVFMCRYVPGTGEQVVLKLAAMLQEMKKERG